MQHIKTNKQAINKKQSTIFFVCTNPERALGLETELTNYHIICIDDSPILKTLTKNIFCLSRETNDKIKRNSNSLLQHDLVQQYINKHTPDNTTPNIIVFKIAPNIERTIEKLGWNILNTTSELNHKFEHKISQYQILSKENIKFPKTIITKIGDTTYENLSQIFNNEFVLQFNRGHSGEGTLFINSAKQYIELTDKFPNREVRISEKIDGEAWTINACVTRYGVAIGGLSYQVTGLPLLTQHKGGTVGNDWTKSKELSPQVIESIINETNKIGKVMQSSRYKGLFGIDFIITSNNELYIIEVNARQIASIAMHNKLMLKNNQIPLSKLHIAEFLFKSNQVEQYQKFIGKEINENILLQQNKEAIKPIQASQLILRRMENSNSKRIKTNSGIYEDNIYKKPGYSINDLENNNQYLLLVQNFGSDTAIIQAYQPYKFILKKYKKLLSKTEIE